eukprot:14213890-Alexandrium_andersonii.AAC.1
MFWRSCRAEGRASKTRRDMPPMPPALSARKQNFWRQAWNKQATFTPQPTAKTTRGSLWRMGSNLGSLHCK